MTTQSVASLESALSTFLEHSVKLLSADEAGMLLEHAASCEKCAGRLGEKPAHAEALLESMHPAPKWTAEEEEVVRAVQNEIVVFADAVLGRLAPEIDARHRAALSEPLAPDRHKEFWALDDIDTPLLHIALACSAAKLAVRSWLATGPRGLRRVTLTRDGLKVDGKIVPNSTFAEQLADYAVVPTDLADKTWNTIRQVAIEGRLGLPGIYSRMGEGDTLDLALTAKGLERLNANAMSALLMTATASGGGGSFSSSSSSSGT